jgi:hypothetical protein
VTVAPETIVRFHDAAKVLSAGLAAGGHDRLEALAWIAAVVKVDTDRQPGWCADEYREWLTGRLGL